MGNPFLADTDKPLVALAGARCGYVQLAPAREITRYAGLPGEIFQAAQDWAARLESLGAHRVYWITLSEVVPHLHIHLYPRWDDAEPRGISLFEQREQPGQPGWSAQADTALAEWAEAFRVHVIR